MNVVEFTQNDKLYKVCNNCRKKRNDERRKNICDECGIKGIFNFENQKYGIKCKKHIEPGMIDVINPKCLECKKKNPIFNIEGETKALYCKDCAEPGMIDVVNPKCISCKEKRPNYNKDGEAKALYCKDCAEPGMIDVKNIKCVTCKKKQPTYNKEGETKALYCKDCANPDMIDVKSIKCITCKKKQSVFNKEGETKALYCKDCADPDMIDVKSIKCITCKKKRPTYNKEGETKALYCNDCAQPGMIDVKHSKCITCKKKRPNYNKEGETKALYCKDCAEPDMIDIKHPICFCKTRATFGYINQKISHCAKHKLPLMFKKIRPVCQDESCTEIAEYGINEPIHCFEHQLENDLCLLGKKCIQCNRDNELCNKDGLCLTYCRPTEIDLNIKKIIKKKEATVLSYLDKNINYNITPIDDKIIDTSCVKNRPDRVYDCGSHFVILEVDENQHKSYTNGCSYDKKVQEQRRMVQIYEALSKGMIPVIFIRFNPDTFRVKEKIQKINMQKRLEMLEKWLKKCIEIDIYKYKEGILIKHLYYDEYKETDINFEKIDNITNLV
jgi:hypothetical protein